MPADQWASEILLSPELQSCGTSSHHQLFTWVLRSNSGPCAGIHCCLTHLPGPSVNLKQSPIPVQAGQVLHGDKHSLKSSALNPCCVRRQNFQECAYGDEEELGPQPLPAPLPVLAMEEYFCHRLPPWHAFSPHRLKINGATSTPTGAPRAEQKKAFSLYYWLPPWDSWYSWATWPDLESSRRHISGCAWDSVSRGD